MLLLYSFDREVDVFKGLTRSESLALGLKANANAALCKKTTPFEMACIIRDELYNDPYHGNISQNFYRHIYHLFNAVVS